MLRLPITESLDQVLVANPAVACHPIAKGCRATAMAKIASVRAPCTAGIPPGTAAPLPEGTG